MAHRTDHFTDPEPRPAGPNAPANIRTIIPVIVGVLAGLATAAGARYGIVIPDTAVVEVVTPVVSGAVTAVYYAAARFLETRVPARVRAFGRLLLTWGLTRHTPAYVPAVVVEGARRGVA